LLVSGTNNEVSIADSAEEWEAGLNKFGICCVDIDRHTKEDLVEVKRLIDSARLKDKVDLIGVSLYFGKMKGLYPTNQMRQFAKELIDLGADFVRTGTKYLQYEV